MIDSATASSAPVVEEAPDTILQQVDDVLLRATGNILEEIAYDQDTLEVRAGAHVKLTFINEGVDMPMVHNVVFTTPDTYRQVAIAGAKIGASGNYVPNDSAVIAASPMVLPGQTVEMEFTAPAAPGVYHFVCTYPEHWQRMHGVLLVK
ncbi:plastocyanin/azurin family copper-binding protein [Pontibacter russatus]|uniref:plastocyanin/azurin family copper-binding protein n=1 Tax=Pontibacter russatus TaxID=2694929 RepID=UPI001F029C78|nr:plastocyanin/azurin family copper-binding protein [Pontibacter russatus]